MSRFVGSELVRKILEKDNYCAPENGKTVGTVKVWIGSNLLFSSIFPFILSSEKVGEALAVTGIAMVCNGIAQYRACRKNGRNHLFQPTDEYKGIKNNEIINGAQVVTASKHERTNWITWNDRPEIMGMEILEMDLIHNGRSISAIYSRSIHHELLDKMHTVNPYLDGISIRPPKKGDLLYLVGKESSGVLKLTTFGPAIIRHQIIIDDLIERTLNDIMRKNPLSEEEYDFTRRTLETCIKNVEDEVALTEGGFTSKTNFKVGKTFVKVDRIDRQRKERDVFRADLGEFNDFRARYLGFEEGNKSAVLLLSNLDSEEHGFAKLSKPDRYPGLAMDIHSHRRPALAYDLVLMGLFHREAGKALAGLPPVIYEGVHSLPHYLETREAFRNKSGWLYRRFKDTAINPKDFTSMIEEYRQMQSESRAIIHGDWKPENKVNGHICDFPMVGKGLEIDDIAYRCTDSHEDITLEEMHNLLDFYIAERHKHDPAFPSIGYERVLHDNLQSSVITHLALRLSVMNKRQLEIDRNLQKRERYHWMVK